MAQSRDQYLRVDRKPGGYAVVTLCREPVNTLNLDAWRALDSVLHELEGDPQVGMGWGQPVVSFQGAVTFSSQAHAC